MMRLKAIPAGLLAGGALLAGSMLALPTGASAQEASGRARVLVVPITEENGVKRNFGRKVAERVRDRLGEAATLTSIRENAVRDELSRLKLDEDDLGLVQWRQLAGRLDADLLLAGKVSRASGGNAFNVSFIDARTGDATPIPEFVVQDDGGRGEQEAADRIMEAVEGQVEYQRALLFCSDYLSSQEYEDALRNCEEAARYNPDGMSVRYLTGRVYMGMENWELAREHLDVVVEDNPAHVDALNSLAYTEAQLGNSERAMELYREYLGFNPNDASVRMQIAFDLVQAGEYDGAISLLEDGIARDSTNAEIWEFLGNVQLNKGTTADMALDGTGTGVGGESEAEAGGGQDAAGQAADGPVANEEAIRAAVAAYEKVLELRGDETDPQILKNVVAAYLQLGDLDDATRFAEQAEVRLPEDASLRSLRADVRARAGDYPGAIAAMDEALRLNPELPRGLTKRGFFKLSADDEQGAMQDLRAAVNGGEDPDIVAQTLLSRGYNDYYQNQQYEQAVRLFEVAIDFAPPGATEEQLYFFLAASHFQIGVQIDEANQQAEACAPARRALNRFQQVLPNLNRAGSQQQQIAAQIRESTDVYLYREEAILNKPACR
jgi:tetratricopeptide (TPR) repeat protein